jgi:hypothetical protein
MVQQRRRRAQQHTPLLVQRRPARRKRARRSCTLGPCASRATAATAAARHWQLHIRARAVAGCHGRRRLAGQAAARLVQQRPQAGGHRRHAVLLRQRQRASGHARHRQRQLSQADIRHGLLGIPGGGGAGARVGRGLLRLLRRTAHAPRRGHQHRRQRQVGADHGQPVGRRQLLAHQVDEQLQGSCAWRVARLLRLLLRTGSGLSIGAAAGPSAAATAAAGPAQRRQQLQQRLLQLGCLGPEGPLVASAAAVPHLGRNLLQP